MKILIAVDLQNDFITGALGTPEAQEMLPRAAAYIAAHQGPVLYTLDTHEADYLSTREGGVLPVEHCIRGTWGWQPAEALGPIAPEQLVEKPTFGSAALPDRIRQLAGDEPLEKITLLGLCTDICVISNALVLRAAFPEVPIAVKADCCAGVTPASHDTALQAMRACQTIIE